MESGFGSMEVSEAKRLKTLQDQNTNLKRLLANAMLDNAAKGKKVAMPAVRRRAVAHLMNQP